MDHELIKKDKISLSEFMKVIDSLGLTVDYPSLLYLGLLSYNHATSQGIYEPNIIPTSFLIKLTEKEYTLDTIYLSKYPLKELLNDLESDTFYNQYNKIGGSTHQFQNYNTESQLEDQIEYIQDHEHDHSSEKKISKLDPHLGEEEFELSQTYIGHGGNSNKDKFDSSNDDSMTPQ